MKSIIKSILTVSLSWAFIISVIQAVFTYAGNPEIMLFSARLYLFAFCFATNLLIFTTISMAVYAVLKLTGYSRNKNYSLFYSYFIVFFNLSVLITDFIRLRLENPLRLYDYIFNPLFLFLSLLSLVLLSILLYFMAKLPGKLLSLHLRTPFYLLFFLLLIFFTARDGSLRAPQNTEPLKEDYGISETGIRVIFLAVDGINPDVIDPLFQQGKLPNLKLMDEKGSSFLLETLEPGKSPIIWNSIYTSAEPADHGIKGFRKFKMPFFRPFDDDVQFPAGTIQRYISRFLDKKGIIKSIPYQSIHRRRKAIWDILGEKGKTASIVSGWTLYPSYPVRGNMVSAEYSYTGKKPRSSLYAVYPGELGDSLNEFIIKPEDMDFKDISYYLNASETRYNELLRDRWQARNIFILKKAIAMDRTFFNIALHLWSKNYYDFRELYIRQTDTLAHAYWNYFQPDKYPETDPGEIEIFAGAIPSSYERADEYIGYIMENFLDEKTVLIVASDHGMLSTGRLKKPGDHIYGKPEGLLYIYSPEIVKNSITLKRASVYDIAPTILYLYGFPHASDFKGRILKEALKDEILDKIPERSIKSYGSISIEIPSYYDEKGDKTIEHIKALGYI